MRTEAALRSRTCLTVATFWKSCVASRPKRHPHFGLEKLSTSTTSDKQPTSLPASALFFSIRPCSTLLIQSATNSSTLSFRITEPQFPPLPVHQPVPSSSPLSSWWFSSGPVPPFWLLL